MNKVLIADLHFGRDENYRFYLYEDGTYRYSGYKENMFSFWKIDDRGRLLFKHSDESDAFYRPFGDGADKVLAAIKAYYDNLIESALASYEDV